MLTEGHAEDKNDVPAEVLRRTVSLPLFPPPDSFKSRPQLPYRGGEGRWLASSIFEAALSLRPRCKREREFSEVAPSKPGFSLNDEIMAEQSDSDDRDGPCNVAKRARTIRPREASFDHNEYQVLLDRILGSPSPNTTGLLGGRRKAFPEV